MKKLLSILLLVLIISSCQQYTASDKPYLIVLSLDGFRWDYTQFANTPTFDSIASAGVKAKYVIPAFPTKTFPNHYTMATGLYPDHHGIVLNNFYAADVGRSYNKKDRATVGEDVFYDGEPIWITANKQGMENAILFWVGSEAPTNGIRPDRWSTYEHKLAFESRIDSLVNWLQLPEQQRPQLIMWYYPEPDETGHHYGPESPELIAKIEQLDAYLGQFMTAIRKLDIFPELNIIVTSDHGMGAIDESRKIILDEVIDTAALEVWNDGWNPIFNFKVKPGREQQVYEKLRQQEHLQVWKRNEIPERLHYGTHERIHDITVVADSGWSIYWSWKQGKSLGAHGYDNHFSAMRTIFYAAGPVFKEGYEQEAFENIHLYPLMAEILGLTPADVDGKLEAVSPMLKYTPKAK